MVIFWDSFCVSATFHFPEEFLSVVDSFRNDQGQNHYVAMLMSWEKLCKKGTDRSTEVVCPRSVWSLSCVHDQCGPH